MGNFLVVLMIFLIVIANIIGFIVFKRERSLYSAALIILLLAGVFGGLGIALSLFINDAFAIFYGLNLAGYLLINSIIVFLIAILVTVIKKFNRIF
ncbi:3-isopropylmalate dehydrogenase [Solibacillus sp. FSL W7-1464]|uniref:3-isopropylmalate dehydrogenase n=1 Tax=Solibacillus sp. FSL W7-1464 TaxID=2921706 RepID=UPI0030F641B7